MWFYFKMILLTTNRQTTCSSIILGYLNNYRVHLCVYFGTKVQVTVCCHGYCWRLKTVSAVVHLTSITLLDAHLWLCDSACHRRQNSPTLDVTHLCFGVNTLTILESLKCWRSSLWQLCSSGITAPQDASLPFSSSVHGLLSSQEINTNMAR